MAKLNVATLKETQTEIVMAVFEGSMEKSEAVSQLKGIRSVAVVGLHDAKANGTLKPALEEVVASLDGTIAKLSE